MSTVQTTSEGRALLNAIPENPDDDTPRLVYADLLDESGDPDRAEFIRLQCRLHGTDPNDPRCRTDRLREAALLHRHRADWAADVFGPRMAGVDFSRGFPESCWTTARAFIARGAEWTRRTPLRQVTLRAVSGRADRLARCPHAARLPGLVIDDRLFGDDDLTELAASGHLTGLKSLSVGAGLYTPTRVTDRGVAALAGAEILPRLDHLSVTADWDLGSAGVAALAESGGLRNLKTLSLLNTDIDPLGAFALADARCDNLTALSVIGSRIMNAGLFALAESRRSPKLRSLRLWVSGVNFSALDVLAEYRHRTGLELLDLHGTPLGDADLGVACRLLTAWKRVRLGLSDCSLGHDFQEELARRFPGRVITDGNWLEGAKSPGTATTPARE
jgi:uncharacterized protein (TIGR02996 family)